MVNLGTSYPLSSLTNDWTLLQVYGLLQQTQYFWIAEITLNYAMTWIPPIIFRDNILILLQWYSYNTL